MSSAADPANALHCSALAVNAGPCRLVDALECSLAPGQWLAILGRNGAGKTLTLETLCGLRAPAAGRISVGGEWLDEMRRNAIARRITLVTQQQSDAFDSTVAEHVALGRYPHVGGWDRDRGRTDDRVRSALESMGLSLFAQRALTTLSGGERQRVAIAQALVQDCDVLLLDEPLSQQDPANALRIANELAAAVARGKTIVTSLHDINLSARFATHALLLFGDGRWLAGPAEAMLTTEHLSQLYGVNVLSVASNDRRLFVADPLTSHTAPPTRQG